MASAPPGQRCVLPCLPTYVIYINTLLFINSIIPLERGGKDLLYALCHRTDTGPRIRQTATRISDRSRFRRLAGRSSVLETRECLHDCERMSVQEERRKKMKRVMMVLSVLFIFHISAFAEMSARQGGGMMRGGWWWGMYSGGFIVIIIASLIIGGIYLIMKRR